MRRSPDIKICLCLLGGRRKSGAFRGIGCIGRRGTGAGRACHTAVTPRGTLIADRLKVGDPVSIDDAKLKGTIVREIEGAVVARMEEGRLTGMKLKPEKSLNFPGVDLGLDPLTEQDRRDLEFIVLHADMIGYSFVETAEDVAYLQDELASLRADGQKLALIAKIETPRAVHNLPKIIVQGTARQPFGVMIARGDLAVEMGFLRVAEMQEEILWICEAARIPAIWATQVLEDLMKTGLPSRGEMTDAAMSSRAECVMRNKGPNFLAGVDALNHLLCRMGEHSTEEDAEASGAACLGKPEVQGRPGDVA
jgi:pyruvate kinase